MINVVSKPFSRLKTWREIMSSSTFPVIVYWKDLHSTYGEVSYIMSIFMHLSCSVSKSALHNVCLVSRWTWYQMHKSYIWNGYFSMPKGYASVHTKDIFRTSLKLNSRLIFYAGQGNDSRDWLLSPVKRPGRYKFCWDVKPGSEKPYDLASYLRISDILQISLGIEDILQKDKISKWQ